MNPSDPYQFEVRVSTQFLQDQSDEDEGAYVFAYTIEIENYGRYAAQLLTRHWIITDSNNAVQEVQGEGVVGEQPVIKPGQVFQYSSGCPLPTPIGTMRGSYAFVGQNGDEFIVPVPEFVLAGPHALH